jgi:hypothetical protein
MVLFCDGHKLLEFKLLISIFISCIEDDMLVIGFVIDMWVLKLLFTWLLNAFCFVVRVTYLGFLTLDTFAFNGISLS